MNPAMRGGWPGFRPPTVMAGNSTFAPVYAPRIHHSSHRSMTVNGITYMGDPNNMDVYNGPIYLGRLDPAQSRAVSAHIQGLVQAGMQQMQRDMQQMQQDMQAAFGGRPFMGAMSGFGGIRGAGGMGPMGGMGRMGGMNPRDAGGLGGIPGGPMGGGATPGPMPQVPVAGGMPGGAGT